MKWIPLLLISLSALAGSPDKYPDFATLAKNETAGVDYKISTYDRNSSLSIFAIHGGLIEPGTDEMARELAGDQFNLYVFEGLKVQDSFSMHLTSAKFDEPQALEMAARSKKCLSVHGYIGDGSKGICIGGSDKEFATQISNNLKVANLGLEVLFPCKLFAGTHPKNIVNRCQDKGVQLEISQGLWDELKVDSTLREALIRTLKNSIQR